MDTVSPTKEEFEAAAIAGVKALAKGTNRQELRSGILRAFGTASMSRLIHKNGIEYDEEEDDREPIDELVSPMMINTQLGSDLLGAVVGLLKADFDFRQEHAGETQSGQAWAFKLGGAITPVRQDLERICERVFDSSSIANNIKTNAMSALRKLP